MNFESTESEFKKTLSNCSKTAKKAYKQVLEYQQKTKSILHGLNLSLGKITFNLLEEEDAKHFEFYEVLQNITTGLKNDSRNGLKDLNFSLEVKYEHLKDFTITLFGRTKAGKSTIRESLTKTGDGSTIGLGDLHTTKETKDYKWKGLRLIDTPGVEGYNGEKETEIAREVIDQTDIVIFLTTDETQQPGEFDEMERLIEINKQFFIILNVKDNLTKPIYLQRFLMHNGKLFERAKIKEHNQRILSEAKRIGIHNVNIICISALASCISQFAERSFTHQKKENFLSTIQHKQIRPIISWFVNNLKNKDARNLWELSKIEDVYKQISFEVKTRGQQRRVLTLFDGTIYFIDTIMKMLSERQHSLLSQAKFMLEKQWELECFFDGIDFKGVLKKLITGDLTDGKAKFLTWKLKRYIKRVQKIITPEDMKFVKAEIGDWSNLIKHVENKNKKLFELSDVFEKYLPRRNGFVNECEEKIEIRCRELFQSIKEWIPDFVDEYLGKNNAQSILKRRMNEERAKIEEEMKGLIDEIVKELQDDLNEFSQQYKYDIGSIKPESYDISGFSKGQTGKILKWTGVGLSGVSAVAFGIGYFAAANLWNPVGWISGGVSLVVGFLSWFFGKDEMKEWLKVKGEAKERLWNSVDKMERKTRSAYKTWFYENITTKGRKAMLDQVSNYINGLFEVTDVLREHTTRLRELYNQMNKKLFTWLLQLEGIKCAANDILTLAREQGVSSKILMSASWHIDDRIRVNLEKLCSEHILLLNDSQDIRERVVKSLYPAKPFPAQVRIFKENSRITAKIKVPNKEKGLYIGKNGVNIRLAQGVCGIKIEIN